MIHYVLFSDINSRDFNMGVKGSGTYVAPERDTESFSVDGRDGDIVIDRGRFRNVIIPYEFYGYKDFARNLDDFRSALKSKIGYQRIEDTFHPDEYRMGVFVDSIDPTIYGRAKAGEFTVQFNCKPQRWLKSGEAVLGLTEDGIIRNPTYYNAKPLIRVYGTGTVRINDIECEILDCDEYVDIDCEEQDTYKGLENCNSNVVIPNYPFLGNGNNAISFTVDKIEITPRWYTI